MSFGSWNRRSRTPTTSLHSAKVRNTSRTGLMAALQHVSAFASTTLSASYYDVNKDILYCDDVGSPRRQAVLFTLKQVSEKR